MHRNRLLYTLPEYQQKLRNGYKKLGIFLQNYEDHRVYIFRPVPSCPWLPESRKKYFQKIINRCQNLPSNRRYTFATLTYSTRLYTPVSAAKSVKKHIDLFFKRLGYHHRKVQYFYVIELTDKFMVHIHIIFDQFIPWKKIRSSWYKVTGNYVTDIRSKKKKDAFYYCLKYLNDSKKQSQAKWSFIFSHIDRIWTCSRGFLLFSESTSGKYKFIFSAFDPEHSFNTFFNDPDNDLQSNPVPLHDAIYIAGFTELNLSVKILNQSPDWIFTTPSSQFPESDKELRLSPDAFQLFYRFYNAS